MSSAQTSDSRLHAFPPRPRGLERQVSLSEVLDRVLTKGAVIAGEVVITVADIDLVYLGLNVVLTSVETGRNSKRLPTLEVVVGTD